MKPISAAYGAAVMPSWEMLRGSEGDWKTRKAAEQGPAIGRVCDVRAQRGLRIAWRGLFVGRGWRRPDLDGFALA